MLESLSNNVICFQVVWFATLLKRDCGTRVSEPAFSRQPKKSVLLKNSQNSQKSICFEVSSLIKFKASSLQFY